MLKTRTTRPKSLKRWLADLIKQEVQSGARQLGEPLESERDLCTKYSVSRITVRAALDLLENEDFIRRHRGRGAVIGPLPPSKPNAPVKGLTPSSKLGRLVYIRWSNNPLESNILTGFERYCIEHGLQSVLLDARESHESFLRYLQHPPQNVGGIALIPYDTAEYAQALVDARKKELEIVLLDRTIDGQESSSVTVDNFGGAYQATNHLFQQINRPVYYIGYRASPSSSRERLEGWRSAMEENGTIDWESYLLEITRTEFESSTRPSENWRDGYDAAVRLFDQSTGNSGFSLFAVNDFCAQGVYKAAAERSLKIGQEVLLVGFDDLPLARLQSPPLSSVNQPRESLGYVGAKVLHQRMVDQSQCLIHQVLPVRLVVRDSSSIQNASVPANSPTITDQ